MLKRLLNLVVALMISHLVDAQIMLSEGFEGAVFPPAGWVILNNGLGNSWSLNTVSANSSNGTNSMRYVFTSAAAANTWAFTPPIVLDAGDSVNITFDQRVGLSLYAEAMKVTVGSAQTVGSQTTTLFNNNNLTNTSFIHRFITYKATVTGTYYFAFNCYSPADRYNLYIDNIRIEQPMQYNASITAISSTNGGCSVSSAEIIGVTVKNAGTDTISNFPVKYSINGGPVVTETIYSNINPGASLNYTFTTAADLSATGVYIITAYTALAADGDATNDSITKVLEHIAGGLFVKAINTITPIPDNSLAGAYSPVTFCGLPTALSTSFMIDYLKIDSLQHNWLSDLEIYLISPVNDSVLISSGNGGSGYDLSNIIFTDSASTNINTLTSNGIPAGYYHIENTSGLMALNTGQNPNGEWKLRIRDGNAGDAGVLYKWTLAFKYGTAVNDRTLNESDVEVYPNPSSGDITVRLKSSKADLQVKLINSSGQIVYNATVKPFSSSFKINRPDRGIYLLQISSKDHISSKKVIFD